MTTLGVSETTFVPTYGQFDRRGKKSKIYESVPESLQKFQDWIEKQAPPGPPPREGLIWKPQTHRWIRSEEAYPLVSGDAPKARITIISNMLRKVPPHHAALISRVIVNDNPEITDTGAQNRKGMITIFRYGTRADIFHEVGHSVFDACDDKLQLSLMRYYDECIEKRKGFVSQYAKTDVKEFFCESYMSYFYKPNLLRKKNEPLFNLIKSISRSS